MAWEVEAEQEMAWHQEMEAGIYKAPGKWKHGRRGQGTGKQKEGRWHGTGKRKKGRRQWHWKMETEQEATWNWEVEAGQEMT